MTLDQSTSTLEPVAESLDQHRPEVLDAKALQHLDEVGWVVLYNLAPLEALIEQVLAPLGELVPQYGQKRFWPVETRDAGLGTSLGDAALRLHTELAEFAEPPDYVSLYAERQAEKGGVLELFDTRQLLASLTRQEVDALMSTPLTISAEPPIADRFGAYTYTGPLLLLDSKGLRLRMDQAFVDIDGAPVHRALRDRLNEAAKGRKTSIRQEPGSLVIWNNRYIVHGRTAFSGGDRRLWRSCIRARDHGPRL